MRGFNSGVFLNRSSRRRLGEGRVEARSPRPPRAAAACQADPSFDFS